LTELLHSNDFTCSGFHGDLDQETRNQIICSFRQGISRILITSDILARGIDDQQVSVVVNYDIPLSFESYIHRSGRCGRFGRKGVVINLTTVDNMTMIRDTERNFFVKIEEITNINIWMKIDNL